MKTHTTVNGFEIEYDETSKIGEFIGRVLKSFADKKTGEADLIALVYGPENPILDPAILPGRFMVTAATLTKPEYQILTDLIWRKGASQDDIEKVAATFTVPVSEAAERLGISRQSAHLAVKSGRLQAWKKGGDLFVSQRAIESFESKPRGPKPDERERPSTTPLEFKIGADDRGNRLFLKHEIGQKLGKPTSSTTGTLAPWKRIGILTTRGEKARFFAIEPADEEAEIAFGDLFVKGKFKIVAKVNAAKKAGEAWYEFQAA